MQSLLRLYAFLITPLNRISHFHFLYYQNLHLQIKNWEHKHKVFYSLSFIKSLQKQEIRKRVTSIF